MRAVHVRPEAEIRAAAAATFDEHRERILGLLPEAEVEHVGATSVPGALTKGDVDLLVRLEPARFAGGVAALGNLYSVHQRENWTPTYASFADGGGADPPVGVQVAVAGSADDLMFGAFRDHLIGDPAALAAYNALKRRHDGGEYERYTEAKAEFIERALARP